MDVILLGFIAGFIYGGFRTGFLKRLFGIAFTVIAFLAAVFFRVPVGAVASTFFKDIPPDYANLVGAIIVFPAVLALLHILSHTTINRIHIEGLTKGVDSGLGAIFGAVEAILILSVVVVIVDAYFGTTVTPVAAAHGGFLKDIAKSFNASETVQLLRGTTVPVVLAVIGPILPKDLSQLLPTGLSGLPAGLPGGFVPGASGLPIP